MEMEIVWKHFSYPQNVIIDHSNEIYIAHCCNHWIMCWHEGNIEGRIIIDGNSSAKQLNQLFYPSDLLFDSERNIYVVEHGNHRVTKIAILINKNKEKK